MGIEGIAKILHVYREAIEQAIDLLVSDNCPLFACLDRIRRWVGVSRMLTCVLESRIVRAFPTVR